MGIPGGASGVSNISTSSPGISIGDNFTNPEAELHVKSDDSDGTLLKLESQEVQTGLVGGGFDYQNPDFFILGQKNSVLTPSNTINFCVDIEGKIQSGLFNSGINEQLAVLNNMAIYRSTTQKIRFELTSNEPRMTWKSPGNNFQFFNTTNSTTSLELGENGEVGINTGDFTGNHKLHVKGKCIMDELRVQTGSQWGADGNYLRMTYNGAPKIRRKGNETKVFQFESETTGAVPLRLTSEDKVGVNTANFVDDHELYVGGSVYIEDDAEEEHNLWVEGSMIAEEIFVKLSGDWSDYVFSENYDLMPLYELESFIDENGHLPNFPSAADVEKSGELPLGETERILTEKIEELTLYILELKREIDELKAETKE